MMLTSSAEPAALREAPNAVTTALLEEVLAILIRDLKVRFGLETPLIAVTGLNPHA